MSDEKWLKISDLSDQFGIPQPTIRRYMERHKHHLHTKKHHKSYLISEKSVPILIFIREGYSKGMSGEQIEESLMVNRAPTYITVDAHEDERVSTNINEALSDLGKSVIEGFNSQNQFNRTLLKLLQREHEKIEHLTELIKQQLEAAAALSHSVHQSPPQIDRLTEINLNFESIAS